MQKCCVLKLSGDITWIAMPDYKRRSDVVEKEEEGNANVISGVVTPERSN